METFCEIIPDMENDLSRMKDILENVPEQLGYVIGLFNSALDRLCELVNKEGFPGQRPKICFFKKIKSSVYSSLLYYQTVFGLEDNPNP
jgi:hypothetical protein